MRLGTVIDVWSFLLSDHGKRRKSDKHQGKISPGISRWSPPRPEGTFGGHRRTTASPLAGRLGFRNFRCFLASQLAHCRSMLLLKLVEISAYNFTRSWLSTSRWHDRDGFSLQVRTAFLYGYRDLVFICSWFRLKSDLYRPLFHLAPLHLSLLILKSIRMRDSPYT